MPARRTKESVRKYRIGVALFLLFLFSVLFFYVGAPSLSRTTYESRAAR